MLLARAMRLASLLALLPLACAVSEGESIRDAAAPLVGSDGSTDRADRACHVVLREFERARNGPFTYQTNGPSWVWEGFVDVSEAAAGEGLEPRLLFHVDGDATWHAAAALPSDVPAPSGFVRWRVRLDEGVPGPNTPDVTSTEVQLVPYLALDGGGRLFDHNRLPGDLDNYVLAWARDFAVTRADQVCPPTGDPEPARLVFRADHGEEQIGGIIPGGRVRIEYDTDRLTTCRHSQGGNPLWDITAHVRWEPSFALAHASVRDGAATFDAPAGAQHASIWFENTSASGCQAWDSDFGANYHFDVLAPPSWVGNATVRLSRDTSDPCAGGALVDGFSFDTWVRQRAAITNACLQVWLPGVTDRDDAEVWKRLDVRVRYRGHGTNTPWRSAWVPFDRRAGNDARFAFNLRTIDPFGPYVCPDVPVEPVESGQYRQAALELYFVVNGVELRAADGAPFVGTYVDYAAGGSPGCQ